MSSLWLIEVYVNQGKLLVNTHPMEADPKVVLLKSELSSLYDFRLSTCLTSASEGGGG